MSDFPFDPEFTARLQVENETLRAECALLREEAARVSSLNALLQSRLAIADSERGRLAVYTSTIERSRAWRVVQAMRGLLGRKW